MSGEVELPLDQRNFFKQRTTLKIARTGRSRNYEDR